MFISATNCLWKPYSSDLEDMAAQEFGDLWKKFQIRTNKNYVTWGHTRFDWSLCIDLPEYGYIRRDYEQAVLPHAIGCQAPTRRDEYIAILKGQHGL